MISPILRMSKLRQRGEVIVLGFKPRPFHLRDEALNHNKTFFRRRYWLEWLDGGMEG